jgi:hypothetical protein
MRPRSHFVIRRRAISYFLSTSTTRMDSRPRLVVETEDGPAGEGGPDKVDLSLVSIMVSMATIWAAM